MKQQVVILPKLLGQICDNDLRTALRDNAISLCDECSDAHLTAYHNVDGTQRHLAPTQTRMRLWFRRVYSRIYWRTYWRLDWLIWRAKREFKIILNLAK